MRCRITQVVLFRASPAGRDGAARRNHGVEHQAPSGSGHRAPRTRNHGAWTPAPRGVVVMRTAALSDSGLEGNFESLAPEPALPSQFHDVWWRSHRIGPEPRLALAVLQLAVLDLLKFRDARDEGAQRLYRKAHVWITSVD